MKVQLLLIKSNNVSYLLAPSYFSIWVFQLWNEITYTYELNIQSIDLSCFTYVDFIEL